MIRFFFSILLISDTEYNRDEPDEHEPDYSADFAIVINGHSLVYALNPKMEQLFIEVTTSCK